MEKSRISRRGMLKGAAAALLALDGSVSAVSSAAAAEQLPLVQKTPVIGSKNVTGLISLKYANGLRNVSFPKNG